MIQVLQERVSRRLRRRNRNAAGQFSLAVARNNDSLRRFWQRLFYDFRVRALLGARRNAVWSLKMKVEKLHYMHMNPLKRKWVDHPRDWPWSSFSFYSDLKSGLIRVDPVH